MVPEPIYANSFYYYHAFVEMSELNANSVQLDQTLHSLASDLGLHCLPMSLLWDARLKWVKRFGAEWTLLPKLIGQAHFLYKGYLVSFYCYHVL